MKRLLAIILIMLIICTPLMGCKKVKISENITEITLYFGNSKQNTLVEENRSVTINEGDKQEAVLIKELLKGPMLPANSRVLTRDCELLSINTNNGLATVDLSSDYYDFEDAPNKDAIELLARYSIVSTLCTLPYINRVEILIDGAPLINSAGKTVGAISINDIINGDNGEAGKAQKFITLYFASKNGELLVTERRRTDITDYNLETRVVQELVAGSKSQNTINLIAPETKVLSVETKEGICFVNLSHDFIKKYTGGSGGVLLCIYSIVNTLTELDGVDKVQFLIDGAKCELFGEFIFSEPFERDVTLIEG